MEIVLVLTNLVFVVLVVSGIVAIAIFLRKMWNDLLAAIEGISFELKKIREDMTRPDEGDGNRT